VILFQGIITNNNKGIITLIDGTVGSSSFVNDDLSVELRKSVRKDEKIIASTSSFNAVLFRSGFHLKQFIHEGVSKQWLYAIEEPEKYAKWIIMANGDVGEPVYTSLIKKQNKRFLNFYEISYKGKHADIYKLKDRSMFSGSEDKNTLTANNGMYVDRASVSYVSVSKKGLYFDIGKLKRILLNANRLFFARNHFANVFQSDKTLDKERFKKSDSALKSVENCTGIVPLFMSMSICNYNPERLKSVLKLLMDYSVSPLALQKNNSSDSARAENAFAVTLEKIDKSRTDSELATIIKLVENISDHIRQVGSYLSRS